MKKTSRLRANSLFATVLLFQFLVLTFKVFVKMPRNALKFTVSHSKEFPFLKLVSGSESEVLCTLCDGKFSVAKGGRSQIVQHIETQKHIKAKKTTNSNQSMTNFLSSDPIQLQLAGKELTIAYHAAKHQMSGKMVECNSALIRQLFEPKFTWRRLKLVKTCNNMR